MCRDAGYAQSSRSESGCFLCLVKINMGFICWVKVHYIILRRPLIYSHINTKIIMFMKKFFFMFLVAIAMVASAHPVQEVVLPKPGQHKAHPAMTAPRAHFAKTARAAVPRFAEATVTPPADLETSRYRLNAYIFDGSSWELVDRTLEIGIDGNDVYLQGFSVYMPEAWIRGTLNEDFTQVTFPVQYYGNVYGNDLYFYPVTPVGDEYVPIDAVFNFDERAGVFVLDQEQVCYILENAYADQLGWYYMYDSEMSIISDAYSVTVPEGLETQPYMLTGFYMGYYEDLDTWFEGDPLMGSAQVGFDGDDIYIQGLCSYLPKAWVKGHREGESYVFDNGQFFGPFVFGGEVYPLYFMGCAPETNDAELFTLDLDPETGALVAQQWYGICADDMEVNWYDLLGSVVLTPIVAEPAVPADPSVLYYEYYPEDEMGYVMLEVPAFDVDGKPLLTDLLGYQLFCDYGEGPEPYIFWADIYGFDDDQTVIPYSFNDEMNILEGGQLVVVYFLGDGLKRIGVQSVYDVDGETNFSEIGWYELTPTSVTGIVADDNRAIEYYDLMGRRVDAAKLSRGIYVTSDGRKVLVK